MALAWKIVIAAMIGSLIGTLLGVIAWYVWKERAAARQQKMNQAAIIDSLDVLCRALMQKQVESSEAVIRMSVLLDSLPASVAPKVDLAAIHALAEDCERFARGEARRALTAKERFQKDSQRWRLEDQRVDTVLAAVERLHAVLPRWRASLGLPDSE